MLESRHSQNYESRFSDQKVEFVSVKPALDVMDCPFSVK